MNYSEARAKLALFNQEHLLKYYSDLSESEKSSLLSQIEKTDFSIVTINESPEERGTISPIEVTEISEIKERETEFVTAGLQEIRSGHVGAVLLAGGMGTRLGSSAPKGMYNVGITHPLYIFECLIHNLLDVVRHAGCFIHLFVMTSSKNHNATVNFFSEQNFFGYSSEYVHFFMQDEAPAADFNGKIYLEEKWKLACSPNGNGGWYSSMNKNGMLEIVRRCGIEWLNVFAVDNVLQRIADPAFIGAVKLADCAVGSKVIRKASPDEKVGVMCLEDGRPSIVEYYELTDTMRNAKLENGQPAYNFGVILNYLFHVDQLNMIADRHLPLHVVRKKIPFINENGEHINSDTPNGFKYETLILDMIKILDGCLVFEVERQKEFAPIKNKEGVDSVESARRLLELNGIKL